MTRTQSLTARQGRTLRTLMDTYLPALRRGDDPHGFFALSASRVGAVTAAEDMIAGLPDAERTGLLELLDKLAFFQRLERAPLRVREAR